MLRLVASYNTTVPTAGFGKVGLGFIDFRNAGAGDTLEVASITDNIASTAARPRQVVDVAGGRRLQVTRTASGVGADPLAPGNRLAWGQLSNDLTQGFPVNPNFRSGPVTEVFRMTFGADPASGFRTVRIEGQVATTQRGYTFISGGSPDGVDINVYPGVLTPGVSLSYHQLRESDMNPAIDPSVATITIIPTPGAAALLTLAGLAAARRRR
jgi:hypothetical protein